ncbi:putative TetR family transcriptional regulator [Gordonia effusa NBRC 100432]|uniref:Putative TetR family transcriptional regulator n=1 Tax=Gordonia effusa NBRC 100432 TaxID=1077974 RepID=H0QXF0_9ACTN|nr:TetR/AcrR family transcriptional regulator [Gordonia effusa]GAB17501.1 putative TetR family transcriptional regulator [Gordonia effusa NBRC 100432]
MAEPPSGLLAEKLPPVSDIIDAVSDASTAIPKRADARTTRWTEHRIKVRAEFVEASIRAIDTIGPNATLDDICTELGVRKPKLYRFFDDKSDLYSAILENVSTTLWGRLASSINFYEDSVEDIITHLSSEYADVVSEHPNLVTFLVTGQYSGSATHPLDAARTSIDRATAISEDVLANFISSSDRLELTIYSIFGIAASGADWWIRSERPGRTALPKELFVAQLVRSILAVVIANVDADGDFDVSQPLHLARTSDDFDF